MKMLNKAFKDEVADERLFDTLEEYKDFINSDEYERLLLSSKRRVIFELEEKENEKNSISLEKAIDEYKRKKKYKIK